MAGAPDSTSWPESQSVNHYSIEPEKIHSISIYWPLITTATFFNSHYYGVTFIPG